MSNETEMFDLVDHPRVRGLDFSGLTHDDLVNLILQRSCIIVDHPHAGRVIRAWSNGDPEPIIRVAESLGTELAYRAAASVFAEYQDMRPILADTAGPVADIGCGYALFDLFLAQDTNAHLLLIDLEDNEHRHFGFSRVGSAYSDLEAARRLLEANGVAPGAITTLNPRDAKPESAGPVSVAVSFLSCGFHYPVDSYLPFFEQCVEPGGRIVLDIRKATAADQTAKLEKLGRVETVSTGERVRRVLVTKAEAP